MNSILKSLKLFQITAIIASFCFSITFLTAIYFFKQLSNSDLFDFTPILMLLAIAIPAAIFSIIFVQVRAADRSQAVAQQVHARIVELESRGKPPRATATTAATAADPRRASSPQLDRSTPTKDPFETL